MLLRSGAALPGQRQRPPSGRYCRESRYKRGDPQHRPLSGRTACGHHLHLRRKRSQQPCCKGAGGAGACGRQAHPLYSAGAFVRQRQSGSPAKAGVRGGAAGHLFGRHGRPCRPEKPAAPGHCAGGCDCRGQRTGRGAAHCGNCRAFKGVSQLSFPCGRHAGCGENSRTV